jgi:hypothetical protein
MSKKPQPDRWKTVQKILAILNQFARFLSALMAIGKGAGRW